MKRNAGICIREENILRRRGMAISIYESSEEKYLSILVIESLLKSAKRPR